MRLHAPVLIISNLVRNSSRGSRGMSRSSYITIENPDVHNLHNLRPLRKDQWLCVALAGKWPWRKLKPPCWIHSCNSVLNNVKPWTHDLHSNCQDVSIATFTNYNVSQTLLPFKPRGSLRSFWHKYPVPLLTGWQVPAGQLEQTKRHLHSHSEIVCLNAGMPQVLSLTARHKATHRWIGHRSQQARQKSGHSSVKQVRPIQRKTYKILQETGIGHECILEER